MDIRNPRKKFSFLKFLIKLNIGLATVVVFILINSPTEAYSQHFTHPSLTEEIAKFFNAKIGNPRLTLSQTETEWLKQGAVDEDEPARWINHFYDPVHNVGWSGKHYGHLTVIFILDLFHRRFAAKIPN